MSMKGKEQKRQKTPHQTKSKKGLSKVPKVSIWPCERPFEVSSDIYWNYDWARCRGSVHLKPRSMPAVISAMLRSRERIWICCSSLAEG